MDPDTEVADSKAAEALSAFAMPGGGEPPPLGAGEPPPAGAKPAPSGWAAELARAIGAAADDEPAPIGREDIGLNFDDESVVARLEDEGLKARIQQARADLGWTETQRAWPDAQVGPAAERPPRPDLTEARRADAEARRAMSQLITALGECLRDLRSGADDVFLQASNARKLSQNQLPHGYTAGSVASYFDRLGDQTGKVGDTLEKLSTTLAGLLRDAVLARRGYENVAADLFRHCDEGTGPA